MATTSPDNIWTPDAGDAYALTTDLAATADSVQDAITSVRGDNRSFSGLEANKPSPGVEGRTWYSTDTDRGWFDTGAAWISTESGALAVWPTSVVNGTIGANGAVTFSSVASVSLNGVFTSRFREYEIHWTLSGRTAAEQFRLRAAGSDNSANSYTFRRAATSGAGFSEATAVSTAFFLGHTTLANAAKSVRLISPQAASPTYLYGGKGLETDNSSLTNVIDISAFHNVSSSFDGFTLFGAGTVSGTIRVIGYP